MMKIIKKQEKILFVILIFAVCQIFAQEANICQFPRRENRVRPKEQTVILNRKKNNKKSKLIKKTATRVFNKKMKRFSFRNPTKRIKRFSTKNSGEWVAYMFDDFEDAFPNYWILEGLPTWGLTDYRAAEGKYSVWCAASDYLPDGGYVNDMNAWMIDGAFDMTTAKNAELYFDYWINTETSYDSLFVGVSTDGKSFFGNTYSGDSEGWVYDEVINLVEYAGVENLYIGINFESDSINCDYEGAYVDNVELDAYENIGTKDIIDLKLYGLKIIKPEADAKFKFKIKNLGLTKCEAEDYLIKVYVDGLEDSTAYNKKTLSSNEITLWEWQLTYIYPPGLHLIEIKIFSFHTEKFIENNLLQFNLLSKGTGLTVLDFPRATGMVSETFSIKLSATNGTPPYFWSYKSGKVPAGIYVSGDGVVLGSPQISGSYSFEVTAKDANDATAYKKISLEIIEAADLDNPQIFDKILPITFVNSFYKVKLKSVGGAYPYIWDNLGNLPEGLVLDSSGELSGSPTLSGNYSFPVLLKSNDVQDSKTDLYLSIKKVEDMLVGKTEKSFIKIKGYSKDLFKIKITFDIPKDFVLDKYTQLVIYINDYPISFAPSKKSKWRKKAVFKSLKKVNPKSKATLKWTSKNQLKFSFSAKKINLIEILDGYDLNENVIIPIRIIINEKDSGIIQQSFFLM